MKENRLKLKFTHFCLLIFLDESFSASADLFSALLFLNCNLSRFWLCMWMRPVFVPKMSCSTFFVFWICNKHQKKELTIWNKNIGRIRNNCINIIAIIWEPDQQSTKRLYQRKFKTNLLVDVKGLFAIHSQTAWDL